MVWSQSYPVGLRDSCRVLGYVDAFGPLPVGRLRPNNGRRFEQIGAEI